jgi:RecB family exonuclease
VVGRPPPGRKKNALVRLTPLTQKFISRARPPDGRDAALLYRELGWNVELIEHLLRSQREIESFGALGAHDGFIGPDHPLTRALLEQGLSPHTLKDLAECPFKIYGRKVLALYPEEPDAADGEPTHSGRGKMIHEILESFYRGTPLAQGWEPRLEKIAADVFQRFETDHSDLYPLVWQAEQARIMTMLKRFIPLDLADQKLTGYRPREFELEVSADLPIVTGADPKQQPGADFASIVTGSDPSKQPVRITGRIDRLDLAEDGQPSFRVVDYKTGSGGIGKKETVTHAILKGKSFQLPIYMALAMTWLETHPAYAKASGGKRDIPGNAVFYRLEEDDTVGEPLQIGPDFWKEHGERFYKNLSFLVKNVNAGSFYIRPSDSRGYCLWCGFAAVCRKEHKPSQLRSANSPIRQEHETAFTPPKA